LGRKDNGLPANYWIDISRLSALMGDEIGHLVSQLGAQRVVFGTGMPFLYPDVALVNMQVLDAPADVKEKILSGNALRLLAPPR
jgi:predicted TIM-barrel fold metal-dependent hydrolase